MITRRTILLSFLGLAAAGAVGWHAYRNGMYLSQDTTDTSARENPSSPADAERSPASPPVPPVSEGGSERPDLQVLLEERVSSGTYPVLQRPITFSAAFSEEARDIMRRKIAASVAALEKDPGVFNEWMQLAILRKTVDDYEGARQIWEFLTSASPNNAGPYANLAALYAFELKDADSAEKNFNRALALWKGDTSVWRNAYDFYRYVRKDDAKAREMLQKGVEATKSPELQYLLDHYAES